MNIHDASAAHEAWLGRYMRLVGADLDRKPARWAPSSPTSTSERPPRDEVRRELRARRRGWLDELARTLTDAVAADWRDWRRG